MPSAGDERRGSPSLRSRVDARAEPVDVADHRIERGRREDRRVGVVGRGEHAARFRALVCASRRSNEQREPRAASRDRPRPTWRRASFASAASSSSSSWARSRSRRGSTSATSALAGQEIGEQVLVGRQPRQPRLHAVEGLALGESLPLLAAPRVGLRAARRRGRAPRRWAAARGPGRATSSARSPCDRWSATENCESRSTSSPHRSMRTGMIGGRRVHVDDRAAHRELAARFDLVLAPVAHRDELLDELVAVELRARAHDDRLDVLDVRTEPLHERADRRDDDRAGGGRHPARSRHMTRRRRPIVSIAGDTRSNGSVSHAGNSSTASAPRYWRRSPATRSASARVGTASSTGRRAVAARERRGEDGARGFGHGHRVALPAARGDDRRVVGEQRGEPGEGRSVRQVRALGYAADFPGCAAAPRVVRRFVFEAAAGLRPRWRSNSQRRRFHSANVRRRWGRGGQ